VAKRNRAQSESGVEEEGKGEGVDPKPDSRLARTLWWTFGSGSIEENMAQIRHLAGIYGGWQREKAKVKPVRLHRRKGVTLRVVNLSDQGRAMLAASFSGMVGWSMEVETSFCGLDRNAKGEWFR
jgi:hypothetical protein